MARKLSSLPDLAPAANPGMCAGMCLGLAKTARKGLAGSIAAGRGKISIRFEKVWRFYKRPRFGGEVAGRRNIEF